MSARLLTMAGVQPILDETLRAAAAIHLAVLSSW